jgi:ribosomal protein L22
MIRLFTKLFPAVTSNPMALFRLGAMRHIETDATKDSMVNPLFKNIQKNQSHKLNRRDNPHYQGLRVQFGSTGTFRYSPKKLNLIARQIRGLKASDAILQMQFSQKGPAKRMGKMLLQTVKTAENNQGFLADKLWVREAYVGKGLFLDRMRIHAKGRFGKMQHKFTHMKVVLEERPVAESPQLEKLKSILKKQKLRTLITENLSPVYQPPPWSFRARMRPIRFREPFRK